MQASKYIALGLLMPALLAASSSADEVVARRDLSHITSTAPPRPEQSSQQAFFATFDSDLGELTRVIVRMQYLVRSEIRSVNESLLPALVSAEVSESIHVSRAGQGSLVSLERPSNQLEGVVMPGERRRLLHGVLGSKAYSFDFGLDAWSDAGGAEQVILDVAFDLSLDSLSDGAAESEYFAGTRIQLSVTYIYTPVSDLLAMESGSPEEAREGGPRIEVDARELESSPA